MTSFRILLVLLLPLLATGPATAHEIRPAIVDIGFDGRGGVDAVVDVNLEALVAGVSPNHADTDESAAADAYNALRALPPDQLRAAFDETAAGWLDRVYLLADGTRLQPRIAAVTIPPAGDLDLARESQVTLSAPLPAGARAVTWAWHPSLGPAIVRARGAPSEAEPTGPVVYAGYLKDGQASEPIPAVGEVEQPWLDAFANYLWIGFTHILPYGLDHILFVVGLFLLSARLGPLAWQVTAFTVAHSVTLALGVLGIIQLSPAIVEPLIAASIVYVAVENIISDKLQKWRPAVVFGFGLLHGLGFAGVLAEVGLQRSHFVTGLVAFNVGVELGQLAVVGLCFLAVGLWFRNRSFYRGAITIPASLAIACVGAWWFVERVGLV